MSSNAQNTGYRDLNLALALLLIFIGAGLALYYPGLQAPPLYDSTVLFKKEPLFSQHDLMGVLRIFPQRPLPFFSFYFNYLMGGMKPAGFRFVNVLLLAATAVGLWRILEHLLNLPVTWQRAGSTERTCVSVGLSMLFLVHPYQTFVTMYIWQRMALMACLFSFWSLAIYLAVRLGKWRHPKLGWALCLLLFVCACLSKENSLIMAGVFILVEVAFLGANARQVISRSITYGGILLVIVTLMAFVERPHGDPTHEAGILTALAKYYRESGCEIHQVVLTQFRIIFKYLSTILVPFPTNIQLVRPQVLSASILQPETTLSGILAATTLGGMALYYLRSRPLAGFGTLFVFASLLPEGLLVPQYAFFGYRAVIPMLGVSLVFADLSLLLLSKASERRLLWLARAGLVVLWIAATVFCAYATTRKVELWNHPVAFWQQMLDRFPTEGKIERIPASQVIFNLKETRGLELARRGDLAAGARDLLAAVNVSPKHSEARYNLGICLFQLGMFDEAIAQLLEAVRLQPDYWEAYNNLGVALAQSGRVDEAVEHFRKAVALKPDDIPARNNLEAALRGLDAAGRSNEGRPAH